MQFKCFVAAQWPVMLTALSLCKWSRLIHHGFTLTLLVTSYAHNAFRFGSAIILLHDLADPWLDLAKLLNYVQEGSLSANIAFILFAIFFIIPRVLLFPFIIHGTYSYLAPYSYPNYYLTLVCLCGLWVLHIIWMRMIWGVIKRSIVGSKMGDPRESDD